MVLVHINFPIKVVEEIDDGVNGKYSNRTHFIIEACREKLNKDKNN